MYHPLQAEQQLGFPAGATAGASSLDTAAPTVSLLHSSIFFFNFLIYSLFSFLLHFSPFPYLSPTASAPPTCPCIISHLSLHSNTHLTFSTWSASYSTLQRNCLLSYHCCRCRAFQTQRQRRRQGGAAMTRMDRTAGRRRTGTVFLPLTQLFSIFFGQLLQA